jgi:hypothetical protein
MFDWLKCGKRKPNPNQIAPCEALSKKGRRLRPLEFTKGVKFICRFCGGKSCKSEDWTRHPSPAIQGLHSDWITDEILATQRPSTKLINEFHITKSFTDNFIFSIFCLQEPGEHPYCGDGIQTQSGFSYDPEEFYSKGIYFYNFGWQDHCTTENSNILKICKTIDFAMLDGKKAAFHCHAGRGRTGLIIAAYLIYKNNLTSKDAIVQFQSRRFGKSLTNSDQVETLKKFEKYLNSMKVIFPDSQAPKNKTKNLFSLSELISRQTKVRPIVKNERKRRIPWMVEAILTRFSILINSNLATPESILKSFWRLNDISFIDMWSENEEKQISKIKREINFDRFQISKISDTRILAQLILDL